jgi:hypothetical protein
MLFRSWSHSSILQESASARHHFMHPSHDTQTSRISRVQYGQASPCGRQARRRSPTLSLLRPGVLVISDTMHPAHQCRQYTIRERGIKHAPETPRRMSRPLSLRHDVTGTRAARSAHTRQRSCSHARRAVAAVAASSRCSRSTCPCLQHTHGIAASGQHIHVLSTSTTLLPQCP